MTNIGRIAATVDGTVVLPGERFSLNETGGERTRAAGYAHRPHSFYIDRYPPGREATLNLPDIDMAWTNDTTAPVLIRTATDATSVVASIYATDHGRRVRAQTGSARPPAATRPVGVRRPSPEPPRSNADR